MSDHDSRVTVSKINRSDPNAATESFLIETGIGLVNLLIERYPNGRTSMAARHIDTNHITSVAWDKEDDDE